MLYSTQELAEASRCDAQVLQAVLDEGDTSSFDPLLVAEAVEAVERADRILQNASNRVDSHLRVRYQLPLPAEAVTANDLETRVADVARLQLWRYPSDEHRTRYNDAIAWLKDVSRGMVSLVSAVPGGGSGTEGATLGRVRTGQGKSQFDWSGY
ncbi:phage protein Gp36 family protein [Vibrio injensis]|uniref:phage protein Gp36 family protein n=1 Tax=Vibrio injensis TaxID=1307414 RepID=UPI000933D77F|nr:phage protein Gp36 family protein [Vibrio injensis]